MLCPFGPRMDPHLSLRLQQLQENLAISAKAIAETTEHLALLVPIPDQSISEAGARFLASCLCMRVFGFMLVYACRAQKTPLEIQAIQA